MSTWVKVAVAFLLGGVLGGVAGGVAQSKLIFSVYDDHDFRLSGEMCLLLGAVTAAAFVLWKAEQFRGTALFCLAGGVLCLLWLSVDRDSQLYQWWNVLLAPQHQQSGQYWNSSRNPYSGFLADALIFNGVPLLWAVALIWWGLKLTSQERKHAGLALVQAA